MMTLVRVYHNCLFIKGYSIINNKYLEFQKEILLFVFYYFSTTQAKTLIKRTTAPIYKKFPTKT